MNVFLKIGNTDLSNKLDYQNFEMNREPVFTTWTDGNQVEHRNSVRSRITGKCKAGFATNAAFTNFVQLVEHERQTNGFYNVTGYVQNIGQTVTFEAFLKITSTAKWDFANSREWHEVTLEIRER